MNELAVGGDELRVVALPEAGARLHRLVAFGRDLLRTPDDPARHLADPFFWGGYVMAPWCNRLAAGPMRFGSRQLDLAANFPDGTAIHGQVYARPWTVRDDGYMVISAGDDGWPWRYEVSERLTVTGTSVLLELMLTNLDDGPMPGGIGLHPWFRPPAAVTVYAARVFPDNLRSDAAPQPVSGRFDLRSPGPMPAGLDATWSDLSSPVAVLDWPDVRATMTIETTPAFVVAASPPDLGAVAVEPQTHAPQGLRRLVDGEPGGMAMLDPGQALSLVVRLAFEELPAKQR